MRIDDVGVEAYHLLQGVYRFVGVLLVALLFRLVHQANNLDFVFGVSKDFPFCIRFKGRRYRCSIAQSSQFPLGLRIYLNWRSPLTFDRMTFDYLSQFFLQSLGGGFLLFIQIFGFRRIFLYVIQFRFRGVDKFILISPYALQLAPAEMDSRVIALAIGGEFQL